jgi:hypothetical protein
MNVRNSIGSALAVVAFAAAPAAFAAGLDLSSAQTEVLGYVTATIAFIVAVGTAVLGLVMIAKAVKWARKAG